MKANNINRRLQGEHSAWQIAGVAAKGPATLNSLRKTSEVLDPGKLADLAVLSQDIFSVPPPTLLATEYVLTFVGEEIVYDAKVIGER